MDKMTPKQETALALVKRYGHMGASEVYRHGVHPTTFRSLERRGAIRANTWSGIATGTWSVV